ncbi:MAG: M48 family metallopeptidase [Patescibacteria group bacterium]|nr:M48 family metallopeptidase [Patescibacteria group bacterium]
MSTMNMQIDLNGQKIQFAVKKNRHARQVRILIHQNGRLTVSAPRFATQKMLKNVIADKAEWIINTLAKCRPDNPQKHAEVKKDFKKNKNLALKLVKEKIATFGAIYNLHPKKIFIRNQSTRWGSCSSRGNLSFNFRLIYLPENLLDYLIAHELCHLGEMNHSHRFWALVAQTIPDFKKRKTALREMGRRLL